MAFSAMKSNSGLQRSAVEVPPNVTVLYVGGNTKWRNIFIGTEGINVIQSTGVSSLYTP